MSAETVVTIRKDKLKEILDGLRQVANRLEVLARGENTK